MVWKLLNRRRRDNAEGLSDEAVRDLIQEALFRVEGEDVDWLWVEAFFLADNTVIYNVRKEGELAERFHREFTLDVQAETVELGTDRKRAQRKVTYEVSANKLSSLTFTYSDGGSSGSDNLLSRVARTLGISNLQGDSVSDVDLREALYKSLQSTIAGFVGIEEVMPSEGLVVYATYVEDTGVYSLYWRTFEASGDDTVTVALNDDEQQVEPVTRYEPVQPAANRGNCGCKEPRGQQKGTDTMAVNEKVKALIDGLISNDSAPFTESDRPHMEAFGVERLTAFAEHCKGSVDTSGETAKGETASDKVDDTPAANAAASDNDDATATTLVPTAEWVKVKALVAKNDEREATAKATLVTQLSANAAVKREFGDALAELDIDNLQRIAAVMGIGQDAPAAPVNYGPRGVARTNSTADDNAPPAAPDLNAAIRASRGIDTAEAA